MKYNVRKTTRTTAIIAFEAMHLPGCRPPEIQRSLPSMLDLALTSTGDLLGLEEGKHCALIIEVRANDLICIKATNPRTDRARYTFFRIDPNYRPLRLAVPDTKLTLNQYNKLLQVNRAVDFEPQSTDERLRKFVGMKHPPWLQRIVDRQLTEWQRHDPDNFYNCAPLPWVECDIHSLHKIAPFAALARFKDRLNRSQLTMAMRNSPKGAVIHALELIPSIDRHDYLANNAKAALEFVADRLTDAELGIVANIEMYTAFSRRARMKGRRRAIMLASSYCISFLAGRAQSRPALQSEIRRSILAFPAQWRASDPHGFKSIMRGLHQYVGMGLDCNLVIALMDKVDSADRGDLAEMVAGMI